MRRRERKQTPFDRVGIVGREQRGIFYLAAQDDNSQGHPLGVFLKLRILKGFKSFDLKLLILNWLQAYSCKCGF